MTSKSRWRTKRVLGAVLLIASVLSLAGVLLVEWAFAGMDFSGVRPTMPDEQRRLFFGHLPEEWPSLLPCMAGIMIGFLLWRTPWPSEQETVPRLANDNDRND